MLHLSIVDLLLYICDISFESRKCFFLFYLNLLQYILIAIASSIRIISLFPTIRAEYLLIKYHLMVNTSYILTMYINIRSTITYLLKYSSTKIYLRYIKFCIELHTHFYPGNGNSNLINCVFYKFKKYFFFKNFNLFYAQIQNNQFI